MKSMMNSILIIFYTLTVFVSKAHCQENDKGHSFKLSDINYEIVGSGTPILMIHGMGVDHRVMKNSFEPIFKKHPNGWRRIYVDLPGMGKTPANEWIKNSDDMVTFLSMFIEKVIPNEDFIIASYSYGGYLARGLISKKKKETKGAIFICPLIITEYEKREVPQKIFYVKDSINDVYIDQQTKLLLDLFLVHQNPTTVKRFNDDILSGYNIGNRVFIDKIRNDPNKYKFSKSLVKEFTIFEKPTLFITAKQDILVGFSDAKNILNFFPNNTYVLIDSAGHAVQIDKQIVFEYSVKNYLNKVKNNR